MKKVQEIPKRLIIKKTKFRSTDWYYLSAFLFSIFLVFLLGTNAVADYTGGMIGGQAKKAIGTGSTTRISTPLKDDPVVQQNDATRVQRPIIPIYSR